MIGSAGATKSWFQSTPAIAGGRIQFHPTRAATFVVFQSTPAIAGGRISIASRQASRSGGFNPRPPLLAGESDAQDRSLYRWPVSIHARHCWRANPFRFLIRALNVDVSIHARHCWRANPGVRSTRRPLKSVSIHARHCWRANPLLGFMRVGEAMFQSTPAIAGGRIPSGAGACWM